MASQQTLELMAAITAAAINAESKKVLKTTAKQQLPSDTAAPPLAKEKVVRNPAPRSPKTSVAQQPVMILPAQVNSPASSTEKMPALKLVDYSDKAFAVVGSGTRDNSGTLRDLGGSFNRFLKCGAGWIFSKKRLDQVEQRFGLKLEA